MMDMNIKYELEKNRNAEKVTELDRDPGKKRRERPSGGEKIGTWRRNINTERIFVFIFRCVWEYLSSTYM